MKERKPLSDSALVLGALFVACTAVCVGLIANPKNTTEAVASWNESLAAATSAVAPTSPPAKQNCMQSVKNTSGVQGAQDYQCVPGCNYTVEIVAGAKAQISSYKQYSDGNYPGQVFYKTPSLNTINIFGKGAPAWQGPFACNTNSTLSATMKTATMTGIPNYFNGAYNYPFTDSGTNVANSGSYLQAGGPQISSALGGGTTVNGITCYSAACLQAQGIPGNYADISSSNPGSGNQQVSIPPTSQATPATQSQSPLPVPPIPPGYTPPQASDQLSMNPSGYQTAYSDLSSPGSIGTIAPTSVVEAPANSPPDISSTQPVQPLTQPPPPPTVSQSCSGSTCVIAVTPLVSAASQGLVLPPPVAQAALAAPAAVETGASTALVTTTGRSLTTIGGEVAAGASMIRYLNPFVIGLTIFLHSSPVN